MTTTPPMLPVKMRRPPLPRVFVQRNDLTDRLSGSKASSVTTIVAPAGYGKSTLMADWYRTAHVRVRRFVMLTLDAVDNDPVRFWTHLTEAVVELGMPVPVEMLPLLRDEVRSAPSALPRSFLSMLLQNLETTEHRGILVLDDLHLIANPLVREGLGMLLSGLPPTIRLVLLSRSVIAGVGMHRFRARGDVFEMTADDLAFPGDRARELMVRVAPAVELESDLVELLLERTGGWVTALQFAATALRNSDTPSTDIRTIAGDNRNIAEFLLGEVLERQPTDRRNFLLDTSLLSTLSEPACRALTGREDCLSVLRALEFEGLFVQSLDNSREIYRYQPMFAEFLRGELRSQEPARLRRQHALASTWYQQAGDDLSSVEHALAGGDHDRAARLITPLVAGLHRQGLDLTLQRWFSVIPAATLSATPALALKQAWMHTYVGQPTKVILWCDRAEAAGSADEAITVESACLRTFAYRTIGDVNATLTWGRTATELLDARDARYRHTDANPRLAMADALAEIYGLAGRGEDGIALLSDHLHRITDGSNIFAGVALPGKMAVLASMMGSFDQVRLYVELALDSATKLGIQGRPPIADAQTALGELLWEQDQLTDSAAAFLMAIDAASESHRVWIHARALIGLARCRLSQQQPSEALAVLDTARRLYRWSNPPPFFASMLAQVQTKFLLKIGDLPGARRALETFTLLQQRPVDMSFLVISLKFAEGRLEDADRAAAAAFAASTTLRRRDVVEWAVLAARVADPQTDGEVEARVLDAMVLGQRHQFLRSLVEPAAPLIAAGIRTLSTAKRGNGHLSPEYLRELDQAVRREMGRTPRERDRPVRVPSTEPLSEGELGVIRFLPTELTYAEIAANRYVSINTVKSQLKSIYRKLGVTTRIGAAERCRKLGLL